MAPFQMSGECVKSKMDEEVGDTPEGNSRNK